ncbi:alpha/beta hydrolase [Amycolatopsis nigrescens]|uniref:alpha/beta hydrolase n=1 Tax=Amycolatopsis nigrescens TaxID=381445 RepID=UPI00036E2364|nr:alpha/beta hydrolase [Amycolatopsis nigrescens]
MNDVNGVARPPLGIRLLSALRKEPDWSSMTAGELAAFSDAENRKRASPLIRVISGFPDRGATIRWREVPLPGRDLRVRVYRTRRSRPGRSALPLVLHVHGGGFVGTAVQSDWVNSHLAARLPAVVVSVEHRLLAPGTPLTAAVDDGWDVLRHLLRHAEWGVDPARTAVFGESNGGLIAALAAIRARESGMLLRAQVLVNPAADLTGTAFDHDSMTRHAHSPTLTVPQLRFYRRLAVPPGTDARAVSPLRAEDLSGLAPALVVVPALDPVADHGRRYAERLRESGTPARLVEHPGAPHGFLSMPGVVPQARAARAQITGFLRDRLAGTAGTVTTGSTMGERDDRH